MKIVPYGETALYVDLEIADPAERRARTHAVARALAARLPDTDIVVGAGSIAVVGVSGWDDLEPTVRDAMGASASASTARAPVHEIRVAYDGADLAEVARLAQLSVDEVIAAHAGRTYEVELIGFLPGFAYLAPLDERLVLGRRSAPRPRVPAGSVGIAGPYTGIYPRSSPGGWHLLGRALGFTAFDPERDPPALFQPGDHVRFVPSHDD
jgi:KipI family sensor histidine kinase inhibitor